MEIFYLYTLLALVAVTLISLQLLFIQQGVTGDLTPGRFRWPVIGECLESISNGWEGRPEKLTFVEHMTVMCSNEEKLVISWWSHAIDKLFRSSMSSDEEAKKTRRMLHQFLKPEKLQRYVGIMDYIACLHFDESWENRRELFVFPLSKKYTFWLACKIFLSLEDATQIVRLAGPFDCLASGLLSTPIDLPGTPFNKAIKASKFIRKELKLVIKQRKLDLSENKASPTQDILSHMLTTPIEGEHGEEPRFMTEDDIANKILGLLIGGHDTASAAITFIVKYLAELPYVYDQVYKEQMEIARTKREGELLTWIDIQKMKYSWKVACEVMRFVPPLQGVFIETLHDSMFDDFRISKGWKLSWSANSTHRNPDYFPEPEKFDPSRFEGSGPAPDTYVPFGEGTRMCPGKEYAWLEILVFMHHIVKRFKWKKLIPNEKIIVNPMPIPANGLPIRVFPHNE